MTLSRRGQVGIIHAAAASRRTGRLRPGFSLAELMIAIGLLGLGLLFIAAALPVGLRYTQETTDESNAEACASYAFDQLEGLMRTSTQRFSLNATNTDPRGRVPRVSTVFVPLTSCCPSNPNFFEDPTYEPLFKVHPFVTQGVIAGGPDVGKAFPFDYQAENAIFDYLQAMLNFSVNAATLPFALAECDAARANLAPSSFDWVAGLPLFSQVGGAATIRAYPPVFSDPNTGVTARDFFAASNLDWTQINSLPVRAPSNPFTYGGNYEGELVRALSRRYVWTALYRRASYLPGADPQLYEVIVIVCRRPSEDHRFPLQDLRTNRPPRARYTRPLALPDNLPPVSYGTANLQIGWGSLAPVPWLMYFDAAISPRLPAGTGVNNGEIEIVVSEQGVPYYSLRTDRYNEPANFLFEVTPEQSAVLPTGSLLIPALNDLRPNALANGVTPQNRILNSFVPSAYDTLPIFEVVDRPDDKTLVVRNDGYMPMPYNRVVPGATATIQQRPLPAPFQSALPQYNMPFACWIIPPPFKERGATGQPVYDKRSPIVWVERRMMRLPNVEVPE